VARCFDLALAALARLPFLRFLGFLPCLIFALVIAVPWGGPKVAVTVLSAPSVTWQGRAYHFCSDACAAAFRARPMDYVPG